MISLLWRAADHIRQRRYPKDHGRLGEDQAHRHLRKHGCTVVARNYRSPSGGGEIDLVAWHEGRLVFVEVKTRSTEDHGDPAGAVDAEKRKRLLWAAAEYARRVNVPLEQARFDIVSVVLGPRASIDWRRDAFSSRG